jgi:hypothetical protein
MRQALVYTAVLVGVYLAVAHATQVGQLLTAAGNTYVGGVKVLQGR